VYGITNMTVVYSTWQPALTLPDIMFSHWSW